MTLVRAARPSDAEAIGEVHVAAIETFGPDVYDAEQVEAWAALDGADGPEDSADIAESDDYWVVADRGGEVVGFGQFDPATGEVVAVYVHPDHAREGVGSALLASLEGYARGIGADELTLTASLNAVPFYERAGYDRVRRVVHETDAGVELECVEMGKALSG